MAITLAVFVAVQVAMPQLVRSHLIPPARSTIDLAPSSLTVFAFGPDGLEIDASRFWRLQWYEAAIARRARSAHRGSRMVPRTVTGVAAASPR